MYRRLIIPLYLSLLITISYKAAAQKHRDTTKIEASGKFIDPVEIVPEFPGGFEVFKKFLQTNLKKVPGASGKRVIITFVVETDGSLTGLKIMRGINENADKEALRVMKMSPKWKPASQNGILYRSAYSIPIKFN